MSVEYDSLVDEKYESDSSEKIWTDYYKPFYSKIGWDFWKVFDYEHLKSEKGRYYVKYSGKIDASNYDFLKGCELGGEMDFNFNSEPNPRAWQKRKYEYYKHLIEKDINMTGIEKNEAITLLHKCKERQHRPCNFSIVIKTGGLNNVKGKLSQDIRSLDRFDIFIFILNDYFNNRKEKEDYMHIVFSEAWHNSKENRECLYKYLKLYNSIEDYFKKNYNIDAEKDENKKLIEDLIESGSRPIDSGKRVLEYLNLAKRYWKTKEVEIKKILSNVDK